MAEPTEDEVRAHLEREAATMERSAETARMVRFDDSTHMRLAAIYRSALAMLDEAWKDKARIDAMERGDVEVQPMGTTACYFNVVTPDGRLYTTAGGKLTLRAAIDQARGA